MNKLNKNIVLIGMPGCGKTTIGKGLAKRLSIKFCDVDEYIVESEGKNITKIFEEGEEHFREIESRAINEICRIYPKVIATGGGVIKRFDNIKVLKENGVIFFIDRPVDDIAEDVDMKSRPLLKDGIEKLYKLYDERYSLYNEHCDYKIINSNIEESISRILSLI